MKKTLLYFAILISAVFVLASCTQTQPEAQGNNIIKEPAAMMEDKAVGNKDSMEKPIGNTHTIEIQSSGFNPSEIIIKEGDITIFVNKDSKPHWPASAIHPTHDIYPDKGGCLGSTFDACKSLSQGEDWQFKFNHKGKWNYHDHINPSLKGVIIVE